MAFRQKIKKGWLEKYFTTESGRNKFRRMWLEERKEHPSFTDEQINTIIFDHLYKEEAEKKSKFDVMREEKRKGIVI